MSDADIDNYRIVTIGARRQIHVYHPAYTIFRPMRYNHVKTFRDRLPLYIAII